MTEKNQIDRYTIISRLHDIEVENNVTVLYAVESGSRAWGFESRNSDWDVRFIYVPKLEWYLRVDNQRDVIELMDGDLDFSGWELRKTLMLLKKSNPSLLEWLKSPIIYYADEDFRERIQGVMSEFFNPIASMYHYNHLYKGNDEHYLQREECSMKRFLYYLRGVLACQWIERYSTQPPVLFAELVDALVDDEEIKRKIGELIRLKKDGEEHDMSVVNNQLMDYARGLADHYNEYIQEFRPEKHGRSTKNLDSILYEMVLNHSQLLGK